MKIHDRGEQWNDYIEIGFGLEIQTESDNIKEIKLASTDKAMTEIYYTKEAFLEALRDMVDEYKLRFESKNAKTTLVIFTDNLMKIEGFFNDFVTDKINDLYVQLFHFFEFRNILKWKDLHKAEEIAEHAQYLIDTLFLPDKYFYITPNQVPRRAIKKACNDTTAKNIYPVSYRNYAKYRQGLFGGLCYAPYKDLIIEEPLICLDLTSAYIYDLLIEKHCITPFKSVNPNNWEYYLESAKMTSIGYYKISYACYSNKVHCFKDESDNRFEKGENTVYATMTSVDLKTLFELANIIEINCIWLDACEYGDLPKYIINEVVKQYIKKIDLKDDEKAYNLQKSIVNGIFGDCIRDYDKNEFNKSKKHPSVAPQWGIWCCSYAKRNLLKLADKVEGWVYSDTDSIYCNDTKENRELVKEYNKEVQNKVKAFCKKYGYDYEKLKDLGTFKIEKEIKKFKAITQKVYMYTTKSGEFKLVAAGLDQSTIKVDESLYTKKLNYGSRLFKYIDEEGYHEVRKGGMEAMLYTIMEAAQAKKQY